MARHGDEHEADRPARSRGTREVEHPVGNEKRHADHAGHGTLAVHFQTDRELPAAGCGGHQVKHVYLLLCACTTRSRQRRGRTRTGLFAALGRWRLALQPLPQEEAVLAHAKGHMLRDRPLVGAHAQPEGGDRERDVERLCAVRQRAACKAGAAARSTCWRSRLWMKPAPPRGMVSMLAAVACAVSGGRQG